jgi:hypothetical protein
MILIFQYLLLKKIFILPKWKIYHDVIKIAVTLTVTRQQNGVIIKWFRSYGWYMLILSIILAVVYNNTIKSYIKKYREDKFEKEYSAKYHKSKYKGKNCIVLMFKELFLRS